MGCYWLGKEKKILFSGLSLLQFPNREFHASGGSDEDRTRYLFHAMEALSQVSYRPDSEIYINKNNQINQQLMIKGDTPFDASPY